MGKETGDEKQFSEKIDRLLAGEEVETGEDINEDYRTAINFARKLVGSRIDPSPEFKDQLKQRLLLELTKQEVEARQKEKVNWFREGLTRLVPQSPVWRSAAAMLVVMLVAVGVLWRTGVFTPSAMLTGPGGETVVEDEGTAPVSSPEMAAEAPRIGEGIESAAQILLEVAVVPPEMVVSPPGGKTEIELLFQNISSESLTVAPFPPAIQVVHSRTGELVRSFPEGDERLELAPAEWLSYTLVWDQEDNNGEPVAPGWYSVTAGDVTLYQVTEPTEVHQSLFLTYLLIQFPQGAMERVIEPNQTLPANDLSITLERVELSAERVVFIAFFTPADYSLPEESQGQKPEWVVPTSAQYTVNGVIRDAGYAEVQYLDEGIRLIWGQYQPYLDPLPSDAWDLVFIVGNDWPMPWEFTVPLQD
jgi:hypothetical protein